MSRLDPLEWVWRGWTVSADKALAYSSEGLIDGPLQAFSDLQQADLRDQVSLLLLKPEGIFEERVGQVKKWVLANDFQLLGSFSVSLGDDVIPRLWKYQWDLFTEERLGVQQVLFASTPLTLLVLRRRLPTEVPFAIELSERKGNGVNGPAITGSLRSVLGQYNLLLNFVHTPDEPIDVLRELSLLLQPSQLDVLRTDLRGRFTGQPAVKRHRDFPPWATDWSRAAVESQLLAQAGMSIDDLAGYRAFTEIQAPPLLVAIASSYAFDMEVRGASPMFGRISRSEWLASQ